MNLGFITLLKTSRNIRRFTKVNLLQNFIRTMAVKIGDTIPNIELHENTPANAVNIHDLCQGKKVLIFGVPGAFTPGCSKTHLPGYVSKSDEIRAKGISEIICVAVNDPFVMSAWGQMHDTKDKVRMLADTNAEFCESLGIDQDLSVLGGKRSKRFSMIVDNGKITQLNVEPDGKGLTCSLVENTLPQI